MEQNKNAFLKNTMTYGAIAGVGMIVLAVVIYLIGKFSQSPVVTFLNFVVLASVIVYGTNVYKKTCVNGALSYGKALGHGVLIGVFSGVIIGFYMFVFFKYIDPSMMDKQLQLIEEGMFKKNPDLTDEQVDAAMMMMQKFMTPFMMFISSVFSMSFWALIISLVSSIFLKKKDDSFDSTFNNQ